MTNLFPKFKNLGSACRTQVRAMDVRGLALRLVRISPIILGLSLVIGLGPTVQSYLFSLIRSDAASIYGSAYQDHLTRFPDLRNWLLSGLQWPFLLVSAAIVFFSLRRDRAQPIFASAILASWIALCAFDLIVALVETRLSAAYLLENLVANAVGALIIALVLVIFLLMGSICFRHLSGPKDWRRLVSGLAILILGTILSSAAFYILDFFYRPLPVKFDVVLAPPVGGFLGTEKSREGAQSKKSEPFRFFPPRIDGATINWLGPGEENKFVANWSKFKQSDDFDVTIEFFADCYGSDKIGAAPSVQNHRVRLSNVKSLALALNEGHSEFGTVDQKGTSGRLMTEFGEHASFSLGRDTNSKNLKITEFVQNDAKLAIRSHGAELAFYVNAPLLSAAGGGVVASARTFTIKVDGKGYDVEFSKPHASTVKKLGDLVCRSVDPIDGLARARITLVGADSFVGALIRITRRVRPDGIYGIDDNILTVAGGNGWVSLSRSSEKDTVDHPDGTLDLLAFKGNVASLDIDNQSMTSRPIDGYTAFGDLVGDFENSTNVRVSGRALALWRNGARVNPTKWERLSWEQRTAIVGPLGALLCSIIGYVVAQIRRNTMIARWPRSN